MISPITTECWKNYINLIDNYIISNEHENIYKTCKFILESFEVPEKYLEQIKDWENTSKHIKDALESSKNGCIVKQIKSFLNNKKIGVPIGEFCLAAEFLKRVKLRKVSLPFDWIFLDLQNLKHILETNFSYFLDLEYLNSQFPKRLCGHKLYRANDFFNHHDPTKEPDRSAFLRRIERFRTLIKEEKENIFFFHVSVSTSEKTKLLLDCLPFLPPKCKILSFIFVGEEEHKEPIICFEQENILQIKFTCDGKNTFFSKRFKQPNRFTDGWSIYCPYTRAYVYSLFQELFRNS